MPLTDGRHAFVGYWTIAAVAAVQAGDIEAEEITPAELEELRTEAETV